TTVPPVFPSLLDFVRGDNERGDFVDMKINQSSARRPIVRLAALRVSEPLVVAATEQLYAAGGDCWCSGFLGISWMSEDVKKNRPKGISARCGAFLVLMVAEVLRLFFFVSVATYSFHAYRFDCDLFSPPYSLRIQRMYSPHLHACAMLFLMGVYLF